MRLKHLAAAIMASALSASVASAQVITPSSPGNWITDPFHVPITGTQAINTDQPRDGLGSLEMTVLNNGAQQTGFGEFAPNFAIGGNFGTLATLNALGYDWMSSAFQSPTLRLYLVVANPSGGTMVGQLGFYDDGVVNGPLALNTWNTTNALAGDFFLRFFGSGSLSSGQVATSCVNNSRSSGFDDRMQTIADWEAACNGASGTVNLAGATIFGVSTDAGSYPGDGKTLVTDNIDDVKLGFVGNAASITNFEPDRTVSTPEPASIALFATGLAGLGGFARRRRNLGTKTA